MTIYRDVGGLTWTCGRVSLTWDLPSWKWRPEFHCTGCCYFWLWFGPLEIGVAR